MSATVRPSWVLASSLSTVRPRSSVCDVSPPDAAMTAALLSPSVPMVSQPGAGYGHGRLLTSVVPLAEQQRELWDAAAIAEGQAILTRVLGTGPYQLQAAIAALHDEAPTAEETDWPQILALYDV